MTLVGVVIPAAGAGERLGVGGPKTLHALGGHTLLTHAVRAVFASGVASAVVVAAPAASVTEVDSMVRADAPDHLDLRVVPGGGTRQQSVWAALQALPDDLDVVLVHDAARCLAPPSLYVQVVRSVEAGHDAVVPALPVVDTLKEVAADGEVVGTPDRSRLRAVQTPQGFRRSVLVRAHRAALDQGWDDVTDDAGLVERLGVAVQVVDGHDDAFKITRPADLMRAEALVAARQAPV